MIKWEQMVFLGNPEYGVDLHPIDFVQSPKLVVERAFAARLPIRCALRCKVLSARECLHR